MNVEFTAKIMLKGFILIIAFLLLANILGLIAIHYFGIRQSYGVVEIFNFNTEKNIPTLYSSVCLIFSAILLFSIALLNKRKSLPYASWIVLSIIFLFLSIDEINSIHENLGGPTRALLNTSGLLYFAWVIPYGIALISFVGAYFEFLIKLPKKIRILFIFSGGLFVTGAIGLELLGGREFEINGNSLVYSLLYTCEESLEMLGIAFFNYALVSYLATQFEVLKITILE